MRVTPVPKLTEMTQEYSIPGKGWPSMLLNAKLPVPNHPKHHNNPNPDSQPPSPSPYHYNTPARSFSRHARRSSTPP